ncbi:MAG: dinitrogenase iron-molybdenum cofactor biosynthesis protein [Pseudomonadota bacterium]
MSGKIISRDVALRIGLAARVLPDIESAQLMQVLVRALGLPLSEEKLSRITVRELQDSADGLFDQTSLPAIKHALDCLWGKDVVEVSDEDLPQPALYQEGDMPGSIRVAVASNNGERLDGHFGSCARFLIYQVSPQECRLIEIASMAASPHKSDDKNAYRAAQIRDCDLLYVVSIGGPAAAKVVKQDIHPIKFPNGGEARAAMEELQHILSLNPPPWLAKVMGKAAEERICFDREEERVE